MKSAFSYYGGKSKMARHIIPLLNEIPHTVFGELFVGGASVLFAKEKRSVGNSDHYREIINDTNDWVITFYRVAKLQKAELLRLIDATLYSQRDYSKAKAILKASAEHDDLTVAWAFYVQIQMSFSNKLFAGWGTGVKSENNAATWNNQKRSLAAALDRLSEVYVSSEDAIRCLERWSSPHSLFFVDPPYIGTDQGHYGGYTADDWQNLCNALDNCNSSYVLSCYPQEVEPKSAQQRLEVSTLCSASGKGKVGVDRGTFRTADEMGDRDRTEVLWVCDRSSGIRSDLAGIANAWIPRNRKPEQVELFELDSNVQEMYMSEAS